MKYTTLGRTGLRVSRLCLGTFNFEWMTDKKEEMLILDKAYDSGINFIDTADIYGGSGTGVGTVEDTLGDWISEDPQKRDKTVLATKVCFSMGNGCNDEGLSAYHIIRACEDSLKRLRTDRIDLYYLHRLDRKANWDEIWQALETLILQGKILYAGTSNFAGWQIVQGQHNALQKKMLGFVADQSRYNLVSRLPEIELLPALASLGMGLMPWSPIAGGLLAGQPGKDEVGRRSRPSKQKEMDTYSHQLDNYARLCQSNNMKPSEVALAWLLKNLVVTAPVIGPRTVSQLESNIHSVEIQLPDVMVEEIEAIWPGYQKAPEIYAPSVYQ